MNDLLFQQCQMAAYLRNPSVNAPPADVEPWRMEVYRDIFFRNMLGLLSSLFPVVKSVLSDDEWRQLVRDFYANHRCETPLFPSIAGEFVEYVCNERPANQERWFLPELVRFEWVQLFLQNSMDELPDLPEGIDWQLGVKPVLSPLCVPLLASFPVHCACTGVLPDRQEGGAVYLLVYRNRSDQVKVMESSAASFRLLQLLEDETMLSIDHVANVLAGEMALPDVGYIRQQVNETLQQFLDCGVLVLSQ